MACAMTRAANNDVSIAQACEQLTRARHTMLAMYSRSSHSQIEGLAKTLLSWRPVPSLRPDEAQVRLTPAFAAPRCARSATGVGTKAIARIMVLVFSPYS
eukprot:scaffold36_cov397-Prasinococcus_capsulatus_cf.AAC.8